MTNRSWTGLRMHFFVLPALQFPPCGADPDCNSDLDHVCAAQHAHSQWSTPAPLLSLAGHPTLISNAKSLADAQKQARNRRHLRKDALWAGHRLHLPVAVASWSSAS